MADQADVGMVRPKTHAAPADPHPGTSSSDHAATATEGATVKPNETASNQHTKNPTAITAGGGGRAKRTSEKLELKSASEEKTLSDSGPNKLELSPEQAKAQAEAEDAQLSEVKDSERSVGEAAHSSGGGVFEQQQADSEGLRHRGADNDQQQPFQGAAPVEEVLQGQAVLEAEVEVFGEEDDDSAWEDVDEAEEEQQGGRRSFSEVPYPGVYARRDSNPELPPTVTTLSTHCGSKVYVVGTAHFSESSQEDVAKTISVTQPDIVLVELCDSRVNLLSIDEETLLREAKNLNFDKVRSAIKQSGVVQGAMHCLLLSMSAHLTEQLGMAPGGEFRRAFKEAQKIPGCRVRLGDRPIHITLRRALDSLSVWQKTRLAWYLLTSKEPISKEEVERCKEKDLLVEMLREMTGEFPQLSKAFVTERDLFLANSLRLAARPIPNPHVESGSQPAVVVGVVGIGHVPGIVQNWESPVNLRELMRIPPASRTSIVMKWGMRAFVVGALSWAGYKLLRLGSHVVVSTYQNLPAMRPK